MKPAGSISLLPIALPQRPSARAFTIQYTTLILIIISFIVGAFGGPQSEGMSKMLDVGRVEPLSVLSAADGGAQQEREGRIPTDSIRIENLFRPASVELDSAKAGAIAAVLKAHDIDAEIDILPDSMGAEDYRIALRQARAIVRFLRDAQVPNEAFRVFVVESRIPEWAAVEIESSTPVRFYRGGVDAK